MWEAQQKASGMASIYTMGSRSPQAPNPNGALKAFQNAFVDEFGMRRGSFSDLDEVGREYVKVELGKPVNVQCCYSDSMDPVCNSKSVVRFTGLDCCAKHAQVSAYALLHKLITKGGTPILFKRGA